jgi:hypothetical protein
VADIALMCSDCGKQTRVSEYAAKESLVCAFCGKPLNRQKVEKDGGQLRIRHMERSTPTTLSGRDTRADEQHDAASVATASQIKEVLGNVHKSRTKVKGPSRIWSWIAFLLVGGLLIGWQYHFKSDAEMMRYYGPVRNVLGGIVWLIVIIYAFDDNVTQGVLCLLLPFYILYFALVRLESYWLRGAFTGVFVALCAELYIVPQQALLIYAQNQVNLFIEVVSKLIVRASEPPIP